jgi:hypothetical protein
MPPAAPAHGGGGGGVIERISTSAVETVDDGGAGQAIWVGVRVRPLSDAERETRGGDVRPYHPSPVSLPALRATPLPHHRGVFTFE